MVYGGFEPQTAVSLAIVPVDRALSATPVTQVAACLLACPDNVNLQLELLSVSFRANTLPGDSSDVDVDIEFIDDSDSDSVTDLETDYDLKTATVLINNEVWRGSQILDPGDVINAEFTTDGDLTTPSQGAAFIVEYRVLTRS